MLRSPEGYVWGLNTFTEALTKTLMLDGQLGSLTGYVTPVLTRCRTPLRVISRTLNILPHFILSTTL